MTRQDEPFPLFGDGGDERDDEVARVLRRALEREASAVTPRGDGLETIVERTSTGRGRRWAPWAAGAAAAAVVAAVAGIGVLGGDDAVPPAAGPTATAPPTGATAGPTASDPSTGDPSAVDPATGVPPTDDLSGTDGPTGAPSEPGAGGTISSVPVYWVGATATTFKLYREFREVPDVGGRVASAVAAMTRLDPLDPDYTSPWSPASSVEASVDGDAVAVDLSADAFAEGVGSELAALAVQQLVYTATAAAQVPGPVTVTVDGEPYDAWGAVALGEPVQRAPMLDVQATTWLLSPQQGSTVAAGPVLFRGYGTAFEGTVEWEVRAVDGEVVAEGFATGGSMGVFGEFAFTAVLAPGSYTVEVWQPDVSGGESPEGPRMFPDSKDFTVR